jgi:hypothetical protein
MVIIMPRNCSLLLLPHQLGKIHKMTVKLVVLGGIHKTMVNGNWRVQLSSFWPSACDCIGTTSDFHILLLFSRPIVFLQGAFACCNVKEEGSEEKRAKLRFRMKDFLLCTFYQSQSSEQLRTMRTRT